MYQFGQFLSTQKSWTSYKEDVNLSDLTFDYIVTQLSNDIYGGNQIKFANYSMKYMEEGTILQNAHYYYLNFKIKRRNDQSNNHEQVFYLRLQRVENDIVVKQQYIKTFRVPNSLLQDDYISFEVIIAPNSNYNRIIWQMQREIIDYTISEKVNGVSYNGRVAIIQVNTFSEIINTIDSFQLNSQEASLSKIGIQGPPSLLICLNGEQIRIGKNGIYELSNSVQIVFLGFIPKKETDYFIIDYVYEGED